ncbi:hypothetical protein [Nonomuraea sp. KM90]|uniref:hypothetical protein n=1 Tax=Nonomuraea sp. KM90 TaxID=3457428 RepID=UPI003FCC821B
MLNGKRKKPQRWKWAASFFRACHRHAQATGLDADVVLVTLSDWHRRYEALLNAPAPAPAAAATSSEVAADRSESPANRAGSVPPVAAQPGTPSSVTPARRGATPVPVSPLESLPVEPGIPTLRDVLSTPSSATRPATPHWPSTALDQPPPLTSSTTARWDVQPDPRHPAVVHSDPALPAAPKPAYTPLDRPAASPPQTPMSLPQPVEQEAAFATLNALGTKDAPGLGHERISGLFGPRGTRLLQTALPARNASRGIKYALACLELGILLVNRNATSEGNQFLQWAQDKVPYLGLGITPRYGDRFHGSIPREICRQVADAYRTAGRHDLSDRWLAYGETINCDEPICLAAFSTGRHAAQTRTIQYFPVCNATKIRKLYWESVLRRPDKAAREQVVEMAPTPAHDQSTFPVASSGSSGVDTRFTTREVELLNAMLGTGT